MCLECGFESGEGGCVLNVCGECVPEGGGSNRESPVPPGATSGLADLQKVVIFGPEGTGGGVGYNKSREVGGCQIIECFVGGEQDFVVDSLFDGEPV